MNSWREYDPCNARTEKTRDLLPSVAGRYWLAGTAAVAIPRKAAVANILFSVSLGSSKTASTALTGCCLLNVWQTVCLDSDVPGTISKKTPQSTADAWLTYPSSPSSACPLS